MNKRRINVPTMENYVARLVIDMQLLKSHPENRDMLERRITQTKEHIVLEALKIYEKANE